MKCVICGVQMDSIKEAVDQGWSPYFYEGETECGPACPECSEILLKMGEDGEIELKEEYHGKIQYTGNLSHEFSEETLLIGIALENSEQSILN